MSEVTGKRDELQEDTPAMNPADLTRTRRRRLLLGAAAVPTVYTLTSGAGVAAASIACWDRSPTIATATRVTLAPDQWARAPMTTGMQTPGQNTTAYCLLGPDSLKQAGCTDPGDPSKSAAQTYWWVGNDKRLEAQGGVWKIPKTSGYGLVYVDKTGTVKAFDPASYSGVELRSVVNSCMASISPATKLTLG